MECSGTHASGCEGDRSYRTRSDLDSDANRWHLGHRPIAFSLSHHTDAACSLMMPLVVLLGCDHRLRVAVFEGEELVSPFFVMVATAFDRVVVACAYLTLRHPFVEDGLCVCFVPTPFSVNAVCCCLSSEVLAPGEPRPGVRLQLFTGAAHRLQFFFAVVCGSIPKQVRVWFAVCSYSLWAKVLNHCAVDSV